MWTNFSALGLTVQPIDYNSSIIVPFLSGINLACLDMHVGEQDGVHWRQACRFSVVLRPRSVVYKHAILIQNEHQHYLCKAAGIQSPNSQIVFVLECFSAI